MAESYYQHAEHYQRIINSFADEEPSSHDREQNQQHSSDRNRADNRESDDGNDGLGLPESIRGKESDMREFAAA